MTENNTYREQFPMLFSGHRNPKEEYRIQLKEDIQPFALSTPQRIAIPLIPKVQEELERMDRSGVIEKVEEPTVWCAGGRKNSKFCPNLADKTKPLQHLLNKDSERIWGSHNRKPFKISRSKTFM